MAAIGEGNRSAVGAGAPTPAAGLLSSALTATLVVVLSGTVSWLAWQQHEQLLRPQPAALYEAPAARAAPTNVVQGTAEWQFVAQTPDGPELNVHVDLPQRGAAFDITFHRNRDETIPASHIVAIEVHAPDDTFGGGVTEIPELNIRSSADPAAEGAALDGLPVAVADGLFWIGLDNDDGVAVARNLALMRRGTFAGLSLVYHSGETATLIFGKGAAGDAAVRKALLAWGRAP